jgi:hypothetical protein
MRIRLARVQQGAGVKEEMALINQSERAVAQTFASNGFTPSSHGAFALKHGDAIRAYIDANSQVQSRYAALTAEFNSLASGFEAARKNKGR